MRCVLRRSGRRCGCNPACCRRQRASRWLPCGAGSASASRPTSVVGEAAVHAQSAHQGLPHRGGNGRLAVLGAILRCREAHAEGRRSCSSRRQRLRPRYGSCCTALLAGQAPHAGQAYMGAPGHVRGGGQPAGARDLERVLDGLGLGAGQHNVGRALAADASKGRERRQGQALRASVALPGSMQRLEPFSAPGPPSRKGSTHSRAWPIQRVMPSE